jgi:hypothetical protein
VTRKSGTQEKKEEVDHKEKYRMYSSLVPFDGLKEVRENPK